MRKISEMRKEKIVRQHYVSNCCGCVRHTGFRERCNKVATRQTKCPSTVAMECSTERYNNKPRAKRIVRQQRQEQRCTTVHPVTESIVD
jgi:hypothetical protein